MNILICEDELIVAEYIKETCLELGFTVCGIAKSREDAMFKLLTESPDLALLDINLDERMSGVLIAEFIGKQELKTNHIFITSFSDVPTLEAAVKTKPQGYLVKPLDKATLIANLLLANYKFLAQPKKELKLVQLETETGVKVFASNEVMAVEAAGNYCDFKILNSKNLLERVSLTVVENTFEKLLVRVHKSYCVNPEFVMRFTSLKLFLFDGTQIPIGRKYKENISAFLSKKK